MEEKQTNMFDMIPFDILYYITRFGNRHVKSVIPTAGEKQTINVGLFIAMFDYQRVIYWFINNRIPLD